MAGIATINSDELIDRIRTRLVDNSRPSSFSQYDFELVPTRRAPFTLIVGAGFSYGVVPLVREMLCESIGDYYYPDQDQSSVPRARDVRRENSSRFWRKLNDCAARADLTPIALDGAGLPSDPGKAYQSLFAYELVDELVKSDSSPEIRSQSFVGQLGRRRAEIVGAQGRTPEKAGEDRELDREAAETADRKKTGAGFLKGFLRYLLDPGSEFGYGSMGRNDLNAAHIYLAARLEAQQKGEMGPFCRTVFTTNFDTLLQNALQMVNLLYCITDRPERGFVQSEFQDVESRRSSRVCPRQHPPA